MLVDTHCHLDFPDFDPDRDQVVQRAKEEGIAYIVNIGSSLKGSRDSLALANKFDFIYAAVGLHPHEADASDEKTLAEISVLARKDKVVAIGEIGLDYFKNYSQADNQRRVFRELLGLAKELDLPVVIHNRQAEDEVLQILKEVRPKAAVIHCFSGGENFLKACLELGFLISFTCNITYKKAGNLRDLVKITPLESLLLETDSPFLSPEGFRGKRNEPQQVKLLAEEVAKLKKTDKEEIARVTTDNARRFFGLK